MLRAFGPATMLQEADVLVIDAPRGASFALDAYRPQHERTHLICRWPDEDAAAFALRVLQQLNKVKRGARLAALTLVLGGGPELGHCSAALGSHLASAIAPSGSLKLMASGASASEMVKWFELLRCALAPSVKLEAWFPSSDSVAPDGRSGRAGLPPNGGRAGLPPNGD